MPVVLPVGHYDAGPAVGPAAAPVTAVFVLLCALVFVGPQDRGRDGAWAQTYGAVPADVAGTFATPPTDESDGARPWAPLTLMTSLVAHASWSHLFYNLLALWVFGMAVERAVGSARMLALYLGVGVLAGAAEVVASAGSSVPIVGASGAVAAAAGAFAVGFPNARVLVAALFLTVPVPAWVALALWAAVEVVAGATAPASGTGIAHTAHMVGFVLGALAGIALLRPRRA